MLPIELPWMRRVRALLAVLAALPRLCCAAQEEASHQWFSMPIEITGLPANSEAVPVSCPIDFSIILQRLKVAGAVDEHSLRLDRILANGQQQEVPLQFSPDPQPASKSRRLLSGTVPQVSYVAEFPARETPEVRVAGTLAWIAAADRDGKQCYRLRFGLLRSGRTIQVPFPPQNLRAFDAQGRATPVRWFPRMQIRPQWPLDGAVHISDQGSLVTSYHVGPIANQAMVGPVRRPFCYPVHGIDGACLTDFGKPHDPTGSHSHHNSLWIAHASVAGHDFWSDRGGGIVHRQFELMEDGPVFCRLVQATRWGFQGAECLRERRTLTVYAAAGDFRLMDFELEFSPPGPQAVELGKTTFGFLAVRVAQSMTPFDGGGEIVNSNGDRNEQATHLKRARWLDQSGPIAAGVPPQSPLVRWGGIAIFDHPGNPSHPTGWHCRNDGWACASFNMNGPHTIPVGGTLRLRYRLHLHSHGVEQASVARRYDEYASQAIVRLGEAQRLGSG